MKKLFVTFLLFIGLLARVHLFGETLAESPSNFHEENAGTEENPFLIANLANLRWLSETTDVWGSAFLTNNWNIERFYFLQTADIDASETINWNEDKGFNPIGHYFEIQTGNSRVLGFFGYYNGNHFKIRNLYINSEDQYYVHESLPGFIMPPGHTVTAEIFPGLFGWIDNATIKNIQLENANIILDKDRSNNYIGLYIGLLIGSAENSTIMNCSVSGSIVLENTISDYQGIILVGSIIGSATRSQIENSYSKANITNNSDINSYLGGLIGFASNSTMNNSYFYGSLISNFEHQNSGGLLGAISSSDIQFCYVASDNSFNNISGLIGSVTTSTVVSKVSHNFWDIETTGVLEAFNYVGGADNVINNNFGLTSIEMKQQSTFITNNWNFDDIWAIDIDINDGYPYLRWQYTPDFFPPSNLKAISTENEIKLKWEAVDENNRGVFHEYRVYRDSLMIYHTQGLFFTDDDVEPGIEYEYYITAFYTIPSGESEPTNIVKASLIVADFDDITQPIFTELIGNFPNPFNPETTIVFSVGNALVPHFARAVQEIRDLSSSSQNYDLRRRLLNYMGGSFRSEMSIGTIDTTETVHISIEIFNIRGQKIKTLVNDFFESGQHQVVWNGLDDDGRSMASGLYFYRLRSGEVSLTQRMVLLK